MKPKTEGTHNDPSPFWKDMQGANDREIKQTGPTVAEEAHSVDRKTLLAVDEF